MSGRAGLMGWVGRVVCGGLLLNAVSCAGTLEDTGTHMALHLNQTGFATGGVKRAVLATDVPHPAAWTLIDAAGTMRARGETTVFGKDAPSGDTLHHITFSNFQEPGTSYVLRVGEVVSQPFTIAARPFRGLKYDALSYFYHNRQGIHLDARYMHRPEWVRQSGHMPDKATCFNGTDQREEKWPGCAYSLDVTGGWYDAGDYGKYVVNAGITVWTLQNYYERMAVLNPRANTQFGDGTAAMPENANGFPDLLDEARWGLEFMLAMQVPDGTMASVPKSIPYGPDAKLELEKIDASGLVHHKVHGDRWPPLPMLPKDDPTTRFLYPPSTAAALNLAAVAAQGARLWANLDPAFAARCLSAARRAFAAAERHPGVLAYPSFDGGGSYGDRDLRDEVYWAAVELYLATGEDHYGEAVRTSPFYMRAPQGALDAMPLQEQYKLPEKPGADHLGWNDLAGAGTISMSLKPGLFNAAEVSGARAAIIRSGTYYLKHVREAGYGQPNSSGVYRWGSNGAFLNRAIFMALAADYSGERRFRDGVVHTMDYMLGRNPNGTSYVSGYGEVAMQNPHHRFWGKQKDPNFPGPPPGALSGGANNTNNPDPVAQAMGENCAPLKCWKDDIEAYSLNEVAINWNAALFWVAAYLDE